MRTLVALDDPALRAPAAEIPHADFNSPRLRSIIGDMKALLAKEEYGVAIAAPQVGESLRLFVVSHKSLAEDAERKRKSDDAPEAAVKGEDEVYINPVLIKMSRGRKDKHEGCLSVRGKWGEVPRAEKCTIRAYNERGEKIERGASGFLAHIFQHEMDHLDGILYIDKATSVSVDENYK